jgi:hypothetical protein
LTLRETVGKYRILAGAFDRPVELAAFGLTREETERTFGVFDEDYHISRFFRFTLDRALAKLPEKIYQINGFPQSHVSLDGEIERAL